MVQFTSLEQPSPTVNKEKEETDKDGDIESSTLLERMVNALHMELLFVRHRIAVKLTNLGQQQPMDQKKSAKKQKVSNQLNGNIILSSGSRSVEPVCRLMYL